MAATCIASGLPSLRVELCFYRKGEEAVEGWPRRSGALQSFVNVNVNVKVKEIGKRYEKAIRKKGGRIIGIGELVEGNENMP